MHTYIHAYIHACMHTSTSFGGYEISPAICKGPSRPETDPSDEGALTMTLLVCVYMYVCIYVCAYICMYIYIYIYAYAVFVCMGLHGQKLIPR